MKIGFYSPYLDALGGGERYILTLASHWSKEHSIYIFWDDPAMVGVAQKRFFLDLQKITVVPNIFQSGTLMTKIWQTSIYDLLFVLSDGSIPITAAKKNILHLQFPIKIPTTEIWKTIRFGNIVCNSEFTRAHIDKNLSKRSIVIYPPVDVDAFELASKAKIILSVGRFDTLKSKKYEILIQNFIKGYKLGKFKGWRLQLAGSLHSQDQNYFDTLQKSVKFYPIEFFANCDFSKLRSLYSKATIYWHAAGFGETNPIFSEHFGITTVEAMASGCIPIVYGGGGQTEIIHHDKDGFIWQTTDELITLTEQVIKKPSSFSPITQNAIDQSNNFNVIQFNSRFDDLLKNL